MPFSTRAGPEAGLRFPPATRIDVANPVRTDQLFQERPVELPPGRFPGYRNWLSSPTRFRSDGNGQGEMETVANTVGYDAA